MPGSNSTSIGGHCMFWFGRSVSTKTSLYSLQSSFIFSDRFFGGHSGDTGPGLVSCWRSLRGIVGVSGVDAVMAVFLFIMAKGQS